MAITSILRIKHDAQPLCLYSYNKQDHTCEVTAVDQWSDDSLKHLDLSILVPASWVYHTQTHVASKNTELLTKSIPFSIEEELSNEVEDNYYAFRLNEDGSQNVIAIEKQHLDRLNEKIEQHQLNVDAIHSEVDWLPAELTEVSIWSDSETALLKLGHNQAMRVAIAQINQLLPVFAQDMQTIICNESTQLEYAELPIKHNLTAAVCCQYLLQQNAINLYLDTIKSKQTVNTGHAWTPVKILASLLVVSWVVVQGIQWYGLKQSIADIKAQQINVFTQNYPNAAPSELVDPFAALQSRMKINNSQSTQAKSMLISMLDKLGQSLQQQQLIKLNSLRLVDQQMELQVVAPNLTVINDFQQLLQQYADDYRVQIGVNELADDNSFKSILTVVPR